MSTALTQPFFTLSAKAAISSGTFPVLTSSVYHLVNSSGLGAGSTAGNVDRIIEVPLAITSGTPYTINVATAADPLGNTAAIVHVSAVIIENTSSTSGQIFTVGGGTHPVLGSDQLTVQPGGAGSVFNPNPGYTVSGGSADTLTITVAAGTAVPGKLTILGRSA